MILPFSDDPPLLHVQQLGRRFALPRTRFWDAAPSLQALSQVSFTLQAGQSLGVVGESGSG
ncbi:MAG: Oligopeptide transport ATP-binding protein OppF, partial [Pseudomonadota bacterium]